MSSVRGAAGDVGSRDAVRYARRPMSATATTAGSSSSTSLSRLLAEGAGARDLERHLDALPAGARLAP